MEGDMNRYPSPYNFDLKEKIAKYRGVRKEQIYLGVGSDEAIDMVVRVFCTPGEGSLLITPPTYGMYKVRLKNCCKDCHWEPLEKFPLSSKVVRVSTQAKWYILKSCWVAGQNCCLICHF